MESTVDADFDLVYLYNMKFNVMNLTVSVTNDNVFHFEKVRETSQGIESSVDLPRNIFYRMIDLFQLTALFEYILAYGEIDFRVHQSTVYHPCRLMKTDSEHEQIIEDFLISNKQYARLSFEVYTAENYKRSIYFRIKTFTEVAAQKWSKRQIALVICEFSGLLVYHSSFLRKERQRNLRNQSASSLIGVLNK